MEQTALVDLLHTIASFRGRSEEERRAALRATTAAAGLGSLAVVDLPLSSAALASATYHLETEDLAIVFSDGHMYVYSVPPEMVMGLVTAGSQDAYFNANIRPLG